MGNVDIDIIADTLDREEQNISVSEAEKKYKNTLEELNSRKRKVVFYIYAFRLLSIFLIFIASYLLLAKFFEESLILDLGFTNFVLFSSIGIISIVLIAFFISPSNYDDMYLSSLAEGVTNSLEGRMYTVTELYNSKKVHPLRETILCDLSTRLNDIDTKKAIPKRKSTQKLGFAAIFSLFLFLFANQAFITSISVNDNNSPILSEILPGDLAGQNAIRKGSIIVVEFNVSDESNFVVDLNVTYASGETRLYNFENKEKIKYPIVVSDNLTYQIFVRDIFGNENISYKYKVETYDSNESEFNAELLLEQMHTIISEMENLGLDTTEESELASEMSEYINELDGASNSKYMEIAEKMHLAAQKQREIGDEVSKYSSDLGSQISINANLIGQFSNYLIMYSLESMGQSSSGGSGSYSSGAESQYTGESTYGEYVPSKYTQDVSSYYSNLA